MDEILIAVRKIIKAKGRNEFNVPEVIHFMKYNGTKFKENTIRTHINSRLCSNAPENHGTTYDDFERIGDGIYKLL